VIRGTPTPSEPPTPPALQLVAMPQAIIGGDGRAEEQPERYCWPLRQPPLPRLLQEWEKYCPPRFMLGTELMEEGAGRGVTVKVGLGVLENEEVGDGERLAVGDTVGDGVQLGGNVWFVCVQAAGQGQGVQEEDPANE
jgi:hypothetical protein